MCSASFCLGLNEFIFYVVIVSSAAVFLFMLSKGICKVKNKKSGFCSKVNFISSEQIDTSIFFGIILLLVLFIIVDLYLNISYRTTSIAIFDNSAELNLPNWVEKGQWGDVLSGHFSAISAVLVFYAVILQFHQLRLTRQELAETRSVMEEQQKTFEAQNNQIYDQTILDQIDRAYKYLDGRRALINKEKSAFDITMSELSEDIRKTYSANSQEVNPFEGRDFKSVEENIRIEEYKKICKGNSHFLEIANSIELLRKEINMIENKHIKSFQSSIFDLRFQKYFKEFKELHDYCVERFNKEKEKNANT